MPTWVITVVQLQPGRSCARGNRVCLCGGRPTIDPADTEREEQMDQLGACAQSSREGVGSQTESLLQTTNSRSESPGALVPVGGLGPLLLFCLPGHKWCPLAREFFCQLVPGHLFDGRLVVLVAGAFVEYYSPASVEMFHLGVGKAVHRRITLQA